MQSFRRTATAVLAILCIGASAAESQTYPRDQAPLLTQIASKGASGCDAKDRQCRSHCFKGPRYDGCVSACDVGMRRCTSGQRYCTPRGNCF